MAEKNICMRCKKSGTKHEIPYKIIQDTDGQSIKFVGQLCEVCFGTLKDRPPLTNDADINKTEN